MNEPEPLGESEETNKQTESISEGQGTTSKSRDSKKKRVSHSGPAHWSEYSLPDLQVGMRARVSTAGPACDVNQVGDRQARRGKSRRVQSVTGDRPSLRYCLLCGSPAHTGGQCDRSNGFKYFREEKAGGSTTRNHENRYERLSSDDSSLSSRFSSMIVNKLSTSSGSDDHNRRNNVRHVSYSKSFDSSLHRIQSRTSVSEATAGESSAEPTFRFGADVVQETQGKQFQEPCHSAQLPEDEGANIGASHTPARQGAQMRFRMPKSQKLKDSLVIEGGIECDNSRDSTQMMGSTYEPCTPESDESVTIICGTVNGVETTMLLDTGSSISAITETFAQQLKLRTWLTRDTLVVTLANTRIEKYPERTCLVTLQIGDHETYEEFNVLPGQIYNVTLGKSWLKRHKAICDYGLDVLRLPGSRPIRMGSSASLEPLCCNCSVCETATNSFLPDKRSPVGPVANPPPHNPKSET